nr:MAG TPA: hypothetical protein [Caudoviricetes sp.]
MSKNFCGSFWPKLKACGGRDPKNCLDFKFFMTLLVIQVMKGG